MELTQTHSWNKFGALNSLGFILIKIFLSHSHSDSHSRKFSLTKLTQTPTHNLIWIRVSRLASPLVQNHLFQLRRRCLLTPIFHVVGALSHAVWYSTFKYEFRVHTNQLYNFFLEEMTTQDILIKNFPQKVGEAGTQGASLNILRLWSINIERVH